MAGNNVRFGAIRWDAWYSQIGAPLGTRRALSAPLYQFRAPFFSVRKSARNIVFQATQDTMDQEILFAKNNGLHHWAFLHYGGIDLAQPYYNREMMRGWDLYQTSTIRSQMPYCWMMGNDTLANYSQTLSKWQQQADLIVDQHMSRADYAKVLTNRPLLYIYWASDSYVTSWWQGNIANMKTCLDYIRNRAVNAGLGNPYIVVTRFTSDTIRADLGADATTGYISRIPGGLDKTYASLDLEARATWAEQVSKSPEAVPICMMGWNTNPRVARGDNRPYFGLRRVHAVATNAELATHLQACVDFINANPVKCAARTALIYAWNENDEGGWLVPTLGDPTGTRLQTLRTIMEL